MQQASQSESSDSFFRTDETLDLPNLAVITKTQFDFENYIIRPLCLSSYTFHNPQLSPVYLAATPSLPVVYTAVVKLHLARLVQRFLGCSALPSSFLAADRL